jgi:DNA adenine methylase
MPSPLRYAGGKTKAIKLIQASLPDIPSKRIVSIFFGGGSFELALVAKGYEVVGYDIFDFLTNFWQHIISQPDKLAQELEKLVPDRENFTRNRHILLNFWEKVKPADLHYHTRDRIELTPQEKELLDNNELLQATYYYYNHQLSYGPMFLGWPSGVYLQQDKYQNIIKRIRNFQSNGRLSVQCKTFEEAIPAHPNDFLFLDPPYYLGSDSKMFKGIYPNSNFAIHHNSFNHQLLADLLKNHRGGFFITYNDCPWVRETYAEFEQEFPKWHYSYGQGETRVGKNRQEGDGKTTKESHEIFIIKRPA